MVVTFNGLVLCLYVPCGNASAAGCHLKAAVHPFYAQVSLRYGHAIRETISNVCKLLSKCADICIL